MATIEISLPDDLVQDANELGLLDAANLETILRNEIREQAFRSLLSIAPKLAAAGVQAMSEEEVVAEVHAARAEQHAAGT
jgi:hypothetical protein